MSLCIWNDMAASWRNALKWHFYVNVVVANLPLPFTSLCRLIVDDAAAALVDSELVPILKTMLSSDKTQLEILCNTLTLARNVAVSSKFPQSYCSLHQA